MDKVDQLVKMANQIADNFGFHEDAVDRIADHLQRFWAPAMRRDLAACAANHPDRLKVSVREALAALDPV